jgi:protein-tyrosine phosphatase
MLIEESTLERRLALEGTYNVRDLGGYATRDGRITRWHTLVRADKLNRITGAGQQALLDYGIRTIIDLRYTDEVTAEPDAFAQSSTPGLTYMHLPLYELSGDGTLPIVPDNLEELYRLILDHRQEQIRRILSTLAAPGVLPGLFHCTAGKDRTGLIAALVLGTMDVPHETIVADYTLSGQYLHTLYDELRVYARETGLDTEWYERLLLCEPETMARTLTHLDRQYGGIKGYLHKIGLTQHEQDSLRAALVE